MINPKLKQLAFCILLLLVFVSCSIQKRSYQKGYYIDWAHKKNHLKNTASSNENKVFIANAEPATVLAKQKNSSPTTEYKNTVEPELLKDNSTNYLPSDSCGDFLSFRDETKRLLNVKVIEVSDETIKYKRCDNLNGPTYSISKDKVDYVLYSNGSREEFKRDFNTVKHGNYNTSSNNPNPQPNSSNLRLPAIITIAIVLSLIPFYGTIAALILAIIGKSIIKNHPEQYKGKNLASFLIFFNISVLLFLIALFYVALMAVAGSTIYTEKTLIYLTAIWGSSVILAALYYFTKPKGY
ncbi:MAG: hypothetical protein JSU07_01905 [Bacteroidetes bacterium]|nr:hypothetical protein [Bacteroidota bacterium]